MPENGEIIAEDYTSSIENLQINDWTKIQMTKTLELLNGKTGDQPSFYSIEGEKVIYNMDMVKDYLTHLCKKEDGTLKTYKEMTDDIWAENIEAGNAGAATTSWTIALQIALEYLGYDVGKIDGNSGGNTGKAIKKFQKDNNLPVDGEQGPKVIESLINALNDELFTFKRRLHMIKNRLQENEKHLGLNHCFEIATDGSLKLCNGSINLIRDRYLDTLRYALQVERKYSKTGENNEEYIEERIYEDINKYFDNHRCPISDIFNGIIHENENRVFEIIVDGNKKIIPFSADSFLDSLLTYALSKDVQIKIVPNFAMGLDSCLLNKKGSLEYDIRKLRDSGTTLEESKPFLDEFVRLKNLQSPKNIDFESFFSDYLDSEMLKFLFGDRVDFLGPILPINGLIGLELYKLKIMWGAQGFIDGIELMIDSGILYRRSKNSIDNIIRSNILVLGLPEYITLCKYLQDKDVDTFPDLQGFSPQEFLNIFKYSERFVMTNHTYHYEIIKNINKYDLLYKNKISPQEYDFVLSSVDYYDEEYALQLMIELFSNQNGKDLYQFLSKYPQKLQTLGGKEIKEIELTTKTGGYNFCFRGILEMIKSRSDIQVPNLKKDGEQKWKEGRERIIKEYENLLKDYILLDKDENGNEIPRKQIFDKIFYANAVDHKDDDRNSALQQNDIRNILSKFTNNFENCSNFIKRNGSIDTTNQRKMVEKVREYVTAHPNENILVYVGTHGAEDGRSSNGWDKLNRLELASISPNVRVMSPRCYFGGAYTGIFTDENYIYGLQSSVSGFSNNTSTSISVLESLQEGYEKGLGFHEMEIYARLHYNYSFTPLTEYMDYRDFRSGKRRHGLVGLADAGNGNGRDDMV